MFNGGGPQWCKRISQSRVYLKWLLPSARLFVRTISRRRRGSVRQGTGDTFSLKQTEVAAAGMEARVLIEAFRLMPTQAECSLCLATNVDIALNQTCQRVWVQSLCGNFILWRQQAEYIVACFLVLQTAETMAHIKLCNSPPLPGVTRRRKNEKVMDRCYHTFDNLL